jgi:hypothetical protein
MNKNASADPVHPGGFWIFCIAEERIPMGVAVHGKKYAVMLHLYIPFIVGDTEGHDLLCGHYTAQLSSVKLLCCACECPTDKTGSSQAKYPHCKPPVIKQQWQVKQLQLNCINI